MILITVEAAGVLNMLTGYPSRLRENLLRVIKRLSVTLQRNVKADKLSGQVLHVRTGTLRRSINQRVEDSGHSIVATVGTNVDYAHVHEHGFNGMVTVREHLRRSKEQMNLARYRTNKRGERFEIKGSYKKAGGGAGETIVHSFERHMKMPERSFLRSALHEMESQIVTEIKQAAMDAKKLT